MSNVPSVSGRKAIKAFGRHGFQVVRTTGSHHIMKKEGQRGTLSIPVHGNRALKRGTLRDLIHQAGLTVDEFIHLLK
jgi:predicted RNA binding protein YcfA (HicA-like mRNA interferase family)